MPVFVGAGTSSFMKGDGGAGFTQATTTQRNAISGPVNGQLIYNTTEGRLEVYANGGWQEVSPTPFTASGGNQTNGTESGGYKYHTFTNSGSFTVTAGEVADAQVLVVGGGGGGGAHNNGGTDGGAGGGGGGVALAPTIPLSPGTYNITVGNGGGGGSANTTENGNPGCRDKNAPYSGQSGSNGGDSVFGASSPNAIKITGEGGGGGGSGPNAGNQDCGGSGGGAGSGGSPGTSGATGNQPNQNPSFSTGPLSQYGNPGGNSPASPIFLGAGGGGAGGGGGNGSSGGPGRGGPGVQLPTAWDASAIGFGHGHGRYYGAGGSGGNQPNVNGTPISGGTGGGGTGHSNNSGPNPGAANGGGGGGGCGNPSPDSRSSGGSGGKGLVVIRYPASA